METTQGYLLGETTCPFTILWAWLARPQEQDGAAVVVVVVVVEGAVVSGVEFQG